MVINLYYMFISLQINYLISEEIYLPKRIFLPLAVLLCCLAVARVTAAPPQPVLVVTLNTEITAATTYMFQDVMSTAEDINARLIIVETDTPGGEVGAVKEIMNMFESSPIPVCFYVYPVGAAAWSGGTYLLVSAHVAAMASGTSIGSCQPVNITGQPLNDTKEVNALTALMVNHASLHLRNATASKEFISENLNLGPQEALRYHVIDLIADDAPTLLEKLQSISLVHVISSGGTMTWQLVPTDTVAQYNSKETMDFSGVASAPLVTYEKGIQATVLEVIFNPVTSGLLFTLGFYLLIIGVQTPGIGAEVVGALCIILGLMSAQVLGLEPTVIVLFILGFGLVVAEIKTQIGLLGIAGAGFILLGVLLMFPSPHWLVSPSDVMSIRNTLVGFALLLTVIFGFLSYKVNKAWRLGHQTGPDTLIGASGVSSADMNPVGEVHVKGEFWKARAIGPPIGEGEEVVVVGREGLLLLVKKQGGEKGSSIGGE
jgi:membrane-bound serine protease (ClpP class)